jgi:glycine dehydrogenase
MSAPATPDEACFADRHIGPSATDIPHMLRVLDVECLDHLIEQVLPAEIRDRAALGLGPGLSEAAMLRELRAIALRNRPHVSLIGQGYHGTILPPVIQRNLLENPAWYTAYTPYQPEISQGRLELLFYFQTMVRDLTGLDIANASLLDEATAAAEAMAFARRVASIEATAFFVDRQCHPQTIDVLRTRAEPMGWTLVIGDPARDLDPTTVFGGLFQYPGTDGRIEDPRGAIQALRAEGAIAIVAADPLALTLLKSPGELGADVAIGSMQRFGVPMGFGGPHAAYIAVRDAYRRALPGRLVGLSIDTHGAPAYRLALQTREQHIRREKATSNICTAQALLAMIATAYAMWHGPDGLRAIAIRVGRLAATLAADLRTLGYAVDHDHFFDTIAVDAGDAAEALHKRALELGVNFRRLSATRIGIALDETSDAATLALALGAFAGDRPHADFARTDATVDAIPATLRRTDLFLDDPAFGRCRSETEMMRYLRTLADRDLALDRTMIPLGSCTMKLNAAAEMIPVSWPEFAEVHPFAPTEQTAGYAQIVADLEAQLCAISGYDAVSLQPNSGAQGELAGLLAIRHYHRARGEDQRNVCLIPASAHGTNPASAYMAGMDVVVVGCDRSGNVSLDDLKAKLAIHGANLAAIMLTYPSTHGVFEAAIVEICDRVHAAGGQVYLDGANLNAQVGLARPGHYGADVSHFNLHKTFCIPHGGGGPGMGPIGVKAHLAPWLPGHVARGGSGAVSAAPFGSASILPISWAYIRMMGDRGLRRASEVAILNANYIAARLAPHFPILFRDASGRVAHECIVDLRPIKDATSVTVDDVAKRLIDFGFHAPTVSFPVTGTLMIEPTESEGLAELDRFCDAMIAIREEIGAIEKGSIAVDDSPLHHAPHTVRDLLAERWGRVYPRAQAAPAHALAGAAGKYWPPVNRIDNGFGDRNLVCACPPIERYADAAE